jgi:hypothetical protein
MFDAERYIDRQFLVARPGEVRSAADALISKTRVLFKIHLLSVSSEIDQVRRADMASLELCSVRGRDSPQMPRLRSASGKERALGVAKVGRHCIVDAVILAQGHTIDIGGALARNPALRHVQLYLMRIA